MSFQFDKKRVLVTGGAGFLGSHLCERLLSEDCIVTSIDNLYCGSKSNIARLISNKNFSFLEHDITQPIKIYADEIYNLACPASPVHYQRFPIETIKTNVIGSMNLLELATKTRAKILKASTSEVYGDPLQHPQRETYWGNVNPSGIRSCYDEGKRCAETLFFDYHRYFGTKIKVVRIFNTYGPNMHTKDGRVVSNFIMQALEGRPLTIYGDGNQTRSFCYVTDMIEAFIRVMNTDDCFIGPVNLGNPHEFTMNELAEKVLRITNSKSKIDYQSLPQDDPKVRRPDITLARSELGWQPTVELDEGLKLTIEYFKSSIEENNI